VKGGILKIIAPALPKVVGYPPEWAPADSIYMQPVVERLAYWNEKGELVSALAESWEADAQALTITWHLRKGVKFTDGTDWNAEALRWNWQLGIDNNRLTDGQYVKSLVVVDAYTLKMNLTAFSWMMFENYGISQMISPTAFQKAGGGDIEKSKTWARLNAVGTGPFKLADFQRDVAIKFTRNENYWRPGMPYLDGIEVRWLPDPMVASATMQAGEADMWVDVAAVQNINDLLKIGFVMNRGPGMFQCLLFNSADTKSIFNNKKVREAVEYALDRPGIAKMLGQGLYEPLQQMASNTWRGYVQGYNPRPFNPAKAKQALAEAGYPNGFKTTMMATEQARDAVAAMQSYLKDVGIIIEPDIADLGRYFGAVFATGWKDIVYTASGINPSTTDIFIHYGPSPMTFRTGNILKSPEYLAILNKALDPKIKDVNEALPLIKEAIKQGGEDAMIVPLWRTINSAIMQPYVHSDYFLIHGIIWTPWDDWMEKKK
jgi:ABC-type transport system substrate-binding protein